MAAVQVICGRCGEVKLPARMIRLVVCTEPRRSAYSFVCPCGLRSVKSAPPAVISILTKYDVECVTVTIPEEAREKHSGPALRADDVLDFALWIADADVNVEDACAPVAASLPA